MGIKKGLIKCKGDLLVNDLTLRGGPLSDILSTNRTKIKCDNKKIRLVDSRWNYGYLDIFNTTEIPLSKKEWWTWNKLC